MPGLPPARRRTFGSRPRPGATPRQRPPLGSVLEAATSEPPPKKRKYIPGGPGGGGRYIEVDGTVSTAFGGEVLPAPRASAPRAPRPPRPRRSELGFIGGATDGAAADPDTPSGSGTRPRRERRERMLSGAYLPAAGNGDGTGASTPRPRYSSAAAATAAMQAQSDGFKPREERGWEEFHQDLDIDGDLPCFDSGQVDGLAKTPGSAANGDTPGAAAIPGEGAELTGEAAIEQVVWTPPKKRGPGRPPRRPPGTVLAFGPDTPRAVPPPGPNPREKLTLPKPTFRRVDPFEAYETAAGGGPQQDYVDGAMASVGYQESEIFIQPPHFIRMSAATLEDDMELSVEIGEGADEEKNTAPPASGAVKRVEYDMDEQDEKFLEEYNRHRKGKEVEAIKPAIFEVTMSFIEKEWHALEKRIPKPNPKPPQTHRPRSSSAAAVNGEAAAAGEEQDSKCAICDDGDCENTNAIVFCDGCDLAVHQECYGVPFIPEGQWLCRKCRVIGSGVPTCIFCPNVDGAFKQTNSSKWAHLLCAIWIPEVSLGNTTFMEPVMDVEKVPRQRWKLTCVICNQKMGACIQCGNKNCFRAFHVTCGRKAKWCLQMKSSHGGPANLDASVLKAYCDKHVPDEWAASNDVDAATADAVHYYRHAMRGKMWATSAQVAQMHNYSQQTQQLMQQHHEVPIPSVEDPLPRPPAAAKDGAAARKNRKGSAGAGPPRTMWRLPSGAPVIPNVLYDSVEALLRRFAVQKRKDFAADMCKYWTLKREARRGAPLIKRLQLQMEMFSSMEITRRDFAAMGAAGGPRLARRKSFTKTLERDGAQLKAMSELLVRHQELLVDDDGLLEGLVDTVHFPMVPLLRRAMDKAISLNGKGYFREGLLDLQRKLNARHYVTAYQFATDFAGVFAHVISNPPVQSAPVPEDLVDEGDDQTIRLGSFASEQKEKRKVAKRILRSVETMLKDTLRHEAELLQKGMDDMPELNLVEIGIPAKDPEPVFAPAPQPATAEEAAGAEAPSGATGENGIIAVVTGKATSQDAEGEMEVDSGVAAAADAATDDAVVTVNTEAPADEESRKQPSPSSHPTPAASLPAEPAAASSSAAAANSGADGGAPASGSQPTGEAAASVPAPPTPPLSHASASSAVLNTLTVGGTAWYMRGFEPDGTTLVEERWTGRDVARAMSDELSDMEEEELNGLVDHKDVDGDVVMAEEAPMEVEEEREEEKKAKTNKKAKGKRKGRKR